MFYRFKASKTSMPLDSDLYIYYFIWIYGSQNTDIAFDELIVRKNMLWDWRSGKAIKQRAVNFFHRLIRHDAHNPDSKKGRVHQLDWIVWQSWYQWPDAIAESISDSPVRKRRAPKRKAASLPRLTELGKVGKLIPSWVVVAGVDWIKLWHRFLRLPLANSLTLAHAFSQSVSAWFSPEAPNPFSATDKRPRSKWVMALWLVHHSP